MKKIILVYKLLILENSTENIIKKIVYSYYKQKSYSTSSLVISYPCNLKSLETPGNKFQYPVVLFQYPIGFFLEISRNYLKFCELMWNYTQIICDKYLL